MGTSSDAARARARASDAQAMANTGAIAFGGYAGLAKSQSAVANEGRLATTLQDFSQHEDDAQKRSLNPFSIIAKEFPGWASDVGNMLYSELYASGLCSGLYDGVASIFTGLGRTGRYLGRSFGLRRRKEFEKANLEGHMADALVLHVANNPSLIPQGISAAVDKASENVNLYNGSRVFGRTVTGLLLAPLGALAGIGDMTYGMDQGRIGIEEQLTQAVYGYD